MTAATACGLAADSRIVMAPPIELPIKMTGPPRVSLMKRSSTFVLASMVVLLPAAGENPNPGRSMAITLLRSASGPAILTQFRCEPPNPCTMTMGGTPAGPPKSTQCTGPAMSLK